MCIVYYCLYYLSIVVYTFFLTFFLHFNLDQCHTESNLPKIEDLKDWLKCSRKSNEILSDSKLMFKTNFNVKNISLGN